MRKTVLALATFGAVGAALLVRFCRVGDHSGAGAQLLPDSKDCLWLTWPALPMGADLGLRSLWVRVRSLRRPLLVPPLALLAASSPT
jgi:hypothetical protein